MSRWSNIKIKSNIKYIVLRQLYKTTIRLLQRSCCAAVQWSQDHLVPVHLVPPLHHLGEYKPKNQTKGWPACLKHTLKERDHYSSIWRCPLLLFQSMFSTILENIFESIVWAVCGQIFVLMEFVQSLPFLLRDGWKMKESWKILPRKKHKVILFVDEDEEDEMTFGALVRIPSCRVGWFLNHDNGPAK